MAEPQEIAELIAARVIPEAAHETVKNLVPMMFVVTGAAALVAVLSLCMSILVLVLHVQKVQAVEIRLQTVETALGIRMEKER